MQDWVFYLGKTQRGVPNFLPEYELCVKADRKSTCQGDSGGPLICEGDISCFVFL